MDPPIKLFGQTIAFTTSASSQDDALDGAGTTSSVAWEELSSSPQDKTENSAESGGGDTELIQQAEGSTGVFPDLSSSGSSGGGDEERVSTSPREVYGLLQPPLSSETPMGGVTVSEGNDSLDGEDVAGGFRHGEEVDGEDQAGGKGGPKMPRRPDKAVACPRCNSLDTKFCYYNNYNVNQPRHFCKHCQRYWTAGGTLRNVPVGAGRRKNKHGSVVPPKQQSPDMGLVRGDEPDVAAPLLVVGKGVQLPVPLQVQQAGVGGSKPVVGVLPVAGCPSDGSIRMLPYGTMRVPSMEGTYIVTSADGGVKGVADTRGGAACNNLHCMPPAAYGNPGSHPTEMDQGNNCNWTASPDGPAGAGLSTATTVLQHSVKCESGGANLAKQQQHTIKGGGDGMMPEWGGGGVPGPPGGVAANGSFGFFNGGWPYGYNVGWSGGAAFCTAGGVASVGGNPGMPPPGVAAAWSSAAAAAGGMWTAGMPWSMPGLSWSPAGWGAPPPWSIGPWAMGPAAAGAPVAMSPAAPRTGDVSGSAARPMTYPPGGTPVPMAGGKHARASDGAVWAPKSLKMADPEEAMRSSVWRILGVGSLPADVETPPASTTFKAFQPKSERKKGAPNGDQQTVQATLHANPAAMSRSMYFHESN